MSDNSKYTKKIRRGEFMDAEIVNYFQLNLGQYGNVAFIESTEEHKKKMLLGFFFEHVFKDLGLTHMDAYAYILGHAFNDLIKIPYFQNLSLEQIEYYKRVIMGHACTIRSKEDFVNEIKARFPDCKDDLSDDSLIELYEYINHFKLMI